MRILFINTHFPGTLGPLLSFLAAEERHECFFVSGYKRQGYSMPGVRHILLGGGVEKRPHYRSLAQEMEAMHAAGCQALSAFEKLKAGGIVPDMVVSTLFGNYALFWEQAFPDSFRVCWTESAETLLHDTPQNALETTRQGLLCRQVLGCHLLVSLSAGKLNEAMPGFLHQRVELPYPVNDDWFAPRTVESLAFDNLDLAQAKEVVLLSAGRGLACSAGLEQFLRTLLVTRRACHIVLLTEGRIGQGETARALAPLLADYPERLLVVGTLSLARYRDLLALATLMLVPGQSPLPSSVLFEAMSTGVPLVLSPQNATESCLRHGTNCLCLPELALCEEVEPIVASITHLLEDTALCEHIGREARATIVKHFSQKKLLPSHARYLLDACTAWQKGKA